MALDGTVYSASSLGTFHVSIQCLGGSRSELRTYRFLQINAGAVWTYDLSFPNVQWDSKLQDVALGLTTLVGEKKTR